MKTIMLITLISTILFSYDIVNQDAKDDGDIKYTLKCDNDKEITAIQLQAEYTQDNETETKTIYINTDNNVYISLDDLVLHSCNTNSN